MLEDANRTLTDAESWRYGEKSSSQEVLINLVQAYKGLLQYYTWSKKKMELSELGESAQPAFLWWRTAAQHGSQTSELVQMDGRNLALGG